MNINKLRIINPLICYFFAWFISISVFEMQFSFLLEGVHEDFLFFLVINFILIVLGFFLAKLKFISPERKKLKIKDDYIKLSSLTYKAIILLVCVEFVQIVYSDGVPIVWALTGNGKTYFDFGIKSVNGLVNSLYLVIELNISILYAAKFNSKKNRNLFLLLLLLPIVILSRQLIVSSCMEFIVIYLSYNRISLKACIRGIVLIIVSIFGFGYLGDIRTGAEVFRSLAQVRYDWLENLPSGILWVGIYISTPIANLQNTLEYVQPDDVYIHTFERLMPSIFQRENEVALLSNMTHDTGLIASNFTVSSYMHPPLLDQGEWFVYLVTFAVGIIGGLIYYTALKKRIYIYIAFNCIFSMMCLLSIFDNMFFYLPVVFQFAIVYIFHRIGVYRINVKYE